MTNRGPRELDSVWRLSPPGPSMCQKAIPRLGEMTFPRVGVPREPAVVDTVGYGYLGCRRVCLGGSGGCVVRTGTRPARCHPRRGAVGPMRALFAPWGQKSTYLGALYVLLALPVATVYFAGIVAGFSAGIGLVVVWVGVPILLAVAVGWRAVARFERFLDIALLDALPQSSGRVVGMDPRDHISVLLDQSLIAFRRVTVDATADLRPDVLHK